MARSEEQMFAAVSAGERMEGTTLTADDEAAVRRVLRGETTADDEAARFLAQLRAEEIAKRDQRKERRRGLPPRVRKGWRGVSLLVAAVVFAFLTVVQLVGATLNEVSWVEFFETLVAFGGCAMFYVIYTWFNQRETLQVSLIVCTVMFSGFIAHLANALPADTRLTVLILAAIAWHYFHKKIDETPTQEEQREQQRQYELGAWGKSLRKPRWPRNI